MAMGIEDTYEAFAEGVDTVAEERWVAPDDIEDRDLQFSYAEVIDAHAAYKEAVEDFTRLLDSKYAAR